MNWYACPVKQFLLFAFFLFSIALAPVCAEQVTFVPETLFELPFGTTREALGSKNTGHELIIPSEFTMDSDGRFYINDAAKHRIARFSSKGVYQMGVQYPETAQQVFAHADEIGNLWLLIADPTRGIYYGVHDPAGKALKTAIFPQFTRFRLTIGDDSQARVILTSEKDPQGGHLYRFDADNHQLVRDPSGLPPTTHHKILDGDRTYYIDEDPRADRSKERVQSITDINGRKVGRMQGSVIYVTEARDIYTRTDTRAIRVYDSNGSLRGQVRLSGLSSSCATLRFDSHGNLYQLDGIPDRTPGDLQAGAAKGDPRTDPEDLRYSSAMPGMRIVRWLKVNQ